MNPKALAAGLALGFVFSAPSAQAIIVNSDNGSAVFITETVDQFRATLGALNSGAANFAGGRREINWDGVPDASSDPNLFPGDFFNSGSGGRARGIEFSTPGSGFLVSADDDNPTATAPAFGFPGDFIPFSAQRMFSPVGSNITDVTFYNPVVPDQQATTMAFGAVFEDVEARGSTLSFYDTAGNLMLTIDVPRGGSGELSFAGAIFQTAAISRVRIVTGDSILLSNGNSSGPGQDTVVMDDFIYGEPVPVPEPSSMAMLALGLAGVGFALRRRR